MKPADARDRLEERLLSLLYDELPDGEAAALRAELEADPKAAARFAEWQALRGQLATLPEPEPDPQVHYDILREARKAVTPDEAVGGFWGWLERLSFSPAMAGLGLMAAAAGLFAVFNTMDTEQADLAPAPAAKAVAVTSAAPPVPTGVPGLPGAAPASAAPSALALGSERDLDEEGAPPAQADGDPGEGRATTALARGKVAGLTKGEKAKRRPKSKPRKRAVSARKGRKGAEVDDLLGSLDSKAAPRPRRAPAKKVTTKRPAANKRADTGLSDPFGGVKGGAGPSAAKPPAPKPKPTAQAEAPAAEPPAPRQYAPPPPAAPAKDDDAQPGFGMVDRPAAGADASDRAATSDAPAPEAEAKVAAVQATAAAPKPAEAPLEEASVQGDALADEVVEQERRARSPQAAPAGRSAGGGAAAADPLAGPRAARDAGRLREAARAYEDVIRAQRRGATLEQAWFEAAQTYERLGDRMRAVQLYRLVAAANGANAARARSRINALTAPGTGNANRPPVASPMDAAEDARPTSVKE